MVTKNDEYAIEFLSNFKMGTPAQIDKVAYNNIKLCYKRLKKLSDGKLIYKIDNTIGQGCIYSYKNVRSAKQFTHCSIRNDFYIKLKNVAVIEEYNVEQRYGSIMPDLYVRCKYHGKEYSFFVEIETYQNHSKIDYEKYNSFWLREYRDHFKTRGTVIYLTDKNINRDRINFEHRHIKADLNNFYELFK